MAGTSPLVCREFVESEDFVRSRAKLMEETGLTVEDIDRRVEALISGHSARGDHEAEDAVGRCASRAGAWWASELPPRHPASAPLSTAMLGVEFKCEWLWIEEDL